MCIRDRLYSAIYDAWMERRDGEAGIAIQGNMEAELFCEYREVEESQKKAQAVEKLIQKNLGMGAYRDIYYALLSDDAGKGTAVFQTMQEARWLKDSRRIMEHLGNPAVAKVFELRRQVANEAHCLSLIHIFPGHWKERNRFCSIRFWESLPWALS